MKYPLVSKTQRALAYLIDFGLIAGLGILIAYLITRFTGINDSYKAALEVYNNAEEKSLDALKTLMIAKMPQSLVYAGVFLVLMSVYFIVLPLACEWQTLGRLVMKCRLRVCKTNEKPTLKHLFIREILGNYFFYVLLTIVLMGWNLFMWISIFYGLFMNCSFGDRFSKTKLTDLKPKKKMEFSDLDFEHVPDKDWERMDALEAEILSSSESEEGEES